MRLFLCLVLPQFRASGKDKTMKIKVFNYALWRDEETGTYYTKVNGITTEISKEVYYTLMSHENEDRYEEAMSKKRKVQHGHPLGDSYDLCDEIPDPHDMGDEIISQIMFEDVLSRFDERDRIIIRYFLTKELSSRQIEEKYGIPRNTVSNRAMSLKKILREIYQNLGQN
jgi:RNA polymerase sigma factor (sigma-70 family)